MTSTDRVPTPGDWHDPELAGIAEQVRPVVNAGKARALAFEIVRLCLVLFSPGDNQAAADRAGMVWLFHALRALTACHAWALDIDSGEEAKRPASERLTLLDVAGAADRIASIAWCLSARNRPVPAERWIVHDLAVALRRACGCSALKLVYVQLCERTQDDGLLLEVHCIETFRAEHDHTARTLLPLLIRDVRALLAAAKVDASAIEAAIVAHGGTPS